MKSWLAQGSSGRRVTLLPGTTFLHINGALLSGRVVGKTPIIYITEDSDIAVCTMDKEK